MRKIRRPTLVLLIFCLVFGSGCFRQYYKSMPVTGSTTTSKQKINLLMLMQRMNKYVVVHYNDRKWHINQLGYDSVAGKVNGFIEPVSEPFEKIMKSRGESKDWGRYHDADRAASLGMAHVFLNGFDFKAGETSYMTIGGSQIERIEMHTRAGGRTFGSAVLGVVTIAAAALAVILIIAAFTCGCPHVAVLDGDRKITQGSLFPGAMGKTLERQDYLILNNTTSETHNNLKVRIANELPEVEFINEVKLYAVSTGAYTQLGTGSRGQLVAFDVASEQATAATPLGRSVSNELSAFDSKNYDFSEPGADEKLNSLFVSFPKKTNDKKTLLVIRAKQSKWMEQVAEFGFQQMGTMFPAWAKRVDRAKPETFRKKNISRGVSLNVYQRLRDNWIYIGSYEQAGTTEYRIMTLPVEATEGNEIPEFKLEAAHAFWVVDYIGLSTSWSEKIEHEEITVLNAMKNTGADVRMQLMDDDNNYVQLAHKGEFADIEFGPVRGSGKRFVLSGKGFYRHERSYTNKPNYQFIKEMRHDSLKYHQLSSLLYAYKDFAMEEAHASE